MANPNQSFLDRLDELEKLVGVTDEDVTKGANLRVRDLDSARNTINVSVSIDAINRVAGYFGVTVDYMLGGAQPYQGKKIKDAKPDVVTLNEHEAECIARILLSINEDFPKVNDAYSCAFCPYADDCIKNRRSYFRDKLRDKIQAATGIPTGVCKMNDRYMHKLPPDRRN